MTEYHNLSDEERDRAIEKIQHYLPDDAELLQVSFTGGRAFGWGPDCTDIDLRAYFAKPDWFRTCHAADAGEHHDFSLRNVYDADDPNIIWERWKHYYDFSKTIYEGDNWDQDWYMNQVSVENVTIEFPHSIESQMHRMRSSFQARSVCHTYKEIMIPLHFLYTGEIESNVVKLSREADHFADIDGLEQAATVYKETNATPTDEGLDKEMIMQETEQLFDELGHELASQHGEYEHDDWY